MANILDSDIGVGLYKYARECVCISNIYEYMYMYTYLQYVMGKLCKLRKKDNKTDHSLHQIYIPKSHEKDLEISKIKFIHRNSHWVYPQSIDNFGTSLKTFKRSSGFNR